MADEGNESRSRRMDLNLYLGLPRSPRPRSLDLGSDLALSSLPLSSSSTTEESRAPVDMSGVLGPSDSHPPYSPSHAAYTPDLPLIDPLHPSDDNINPEYSPFMPSYGPYRPSSYTPISPIARETEGPNAPYSPYVQDLPTVEETEGQVVQDVDSHVPYYLVPPPGMVDELFARDVESHVPYSPSAAFNLQQPIASQTGDFLVRDDGSSSRQDFLQYPEFRFRRLIESHRRLRVRRFRSSLPYGGERSSFGTRPLSTSERVTDALSSARSTETTGNHKVSDDDNGDDELDEEVKGKSKSAADFECNICLDLAKEPVVTSCGHLFCWPCLYQWLHLHGDHKECPVCKGEVIESKVIPIYGRGSSDTSVEKKCREEEGSDLKIPPRPHGHRFESWRQQLQRPLLRPGEGVAASLRRIVNEEMRTRNRAEGDADLSLQGIINDAHRRVLTRLRARRMQREDENPESGSSTGEIGLPRTSTSNPPGSDTSALLRDGIDFLHRFSLYGLTSTDRLAAITADIGRGVGRFASNSNQFGASASSVSPQNPEQLITRAPLGATLAADQASASSTMAVIQGDIAVTGASAEPNRAGSSRSLRRRGRSSTSGSLDVDGGALHARKRRRLN